MFELNMSNWHDTFLQDILSATVALFLTIIIELLIVGYAMSKDVPDKAFVKLSLAIILANIVTFVFGAFMFLLSRMFI
jgi:hypothetical protein